MIASTEVRDELKRSQITNSLSLPCMQLSAFPSTKGFEISALVRLDLSYNNISMLPKEIGDMRSLRELWLHDNPLMHLSPIIAQCESLEVIDIRKTRVASLPDEICLLKKLYELDFSDTPLQPLLGTKLC